MIDARRFTLFSVLALGLLLPSAAQAFCGFYVGGADTKVYNNATMVAMMRVGKTTVLSMGNNYQGPAEDFAMVVPVPVVLQKDNVKILPQDVFTRLDKMSAPRLVEYWEQDPCPRPMDMRKYSSIGAGSGTGSGYGTGRGGYGIAGTTVIVEAEFVVGEYEIVILSAKDATGLETWLTSSGYKIPKGAAPFLRPYVEQGSKFFVAKVNPKKVSFKEGMAQLSPLRFHYESDDFALPVRLGLINAKEKQDLIVHILAKKKRYELANYKNVTIPTNLFVNDDVRKRFGEFYAALFDATLEKNPGSVVTEYSWAANSCDPCPEPALNLKELKTLGLDIIEEREKKAAKKKAEIALGVKGGAAGNSADAPSPGRGASVAGTPSPVRVARVRAGNMTVTGALHKDIIRRYLRRVLPRMKRCYEVELETKKKLAGTLVADFNIGPEGEVSNTRVSGMKNKRLHTCIADNLSKVRFAKPPDGKPMKVRYPLVLKSGMVSPVRPGSIGGWGGIGGGFTGDWVLTRLHARYDQKSLNEDLVFKEATPLSGGRGGGADSISKTAEPATVNTFQGRYIIRHPWEGAIECEKPRRGVWGRPPPGVKGKIAPTPALDLAFAARGGSTLASMLGEAVPEAAQVPSASALPTPKAAAPGDTGAPSAPEATTPDEKPKAKKETGCSVGGQAPLPGLLLLLAALWWLGRRRAQV